MTDERGRISMVDIFILLSLAVIVLVAWNLDFPLKSKLRNTEEGLIFRRKFTEDFRLENPQDEIDEIASRLRNPENIDKIRNSE
jgi:hypothetical protein